jgi:hypothetical protein
MNCAAAARWFPSPRMSAEFGRPLRSNSPLRGKSFCLPQDSLDSGVLEIGRVAILPQDALHKDAHPGARAFAVRPVDGHIALEALEQFVCDDFQRVISEDGDGALILGERVIEGDLVLR